MKPLSAQQIQQHYEQASFTPVKTMSKEIAEAREVLLQITRTQNLAQAKELAAAYLSVWQIG